MFVLKYRYDVRRWEGVKRIDEGIILRRGWDSGRWRLDIGKHDVRDGEVTTAVR